MRKVFDYALIIIHGTPGEDGRLQGYLDMMGIPYSSCSMTSSVITFDKITTKRTLAGRGIPLARERFLRRGEAYDPARIVAELGLPLFVKPNANGSSFGVTKVLTAEELPAAVDAAFAQGDEILIEECITGREMGCGILVAGAASTSSRSRRSSPKRPSSTTRPSIRRGSPTRSPRRRSTNRSAASSTA